MAGVPFRTAFGLIAIGPDGYLWSWVQATLENWQSEFLQLFTFVVLTALLIHRGSHESRDGDDELKAQLIRIERRLEELTVPSVNEHGMSTSRATLAASRRR